VLPAGMACHVLHGISPLDLSADSRSCVCTHFIGAAVQVDAAVIEVGLGGVRDATNVLPPSSLAAAVVTAVGHDHAAALGGSIESIAAAKAGILQPGRPAVLGRQPEAAAEAVLLRRGAQGSGIVVPQKLWALTCACCAGQ